MVVKKSLILIFFFIGHILSYGQTVGKKASNAIDYIYWGFIEFGISELQQSANLNDLAAQFYLANCYEYGIVFEKDSLAAFKMYRRTAERGLPDAMSKLSFWYKEGIVVKPDMVKSREWATRFEKKGGNFLLPEFLQLYNEGLKHPENYAVIPVGQERQREGNSLAMKNGGNINSNDTVGSNNLTENNITIVQPASTLPIVLAPTNIEPINMVSDVDQNIPITSQENENTFALIIANENYQDVAKVPNALNDGEVFAEYCKKTLGMPATNVHLVKDATLNNIKREINLVKQIAAAYQGTARLILYYAGHGIPDESSRSAYILPVDGYGSDVSTCYSLSGLYEDLSKMPATQIVVLLDACFSGSLRGEGMLASARGVTIKAKSGAPKGKMVVLSATQGDETAYPYEEQGHGLFTYYLLKKLKESKGDVCLGDLSAYLKDNVVKKSLVVNGKQQTPSTNPSSSLGNSWVSWTLN